MDALEFPEFPIYCLLVKPPVLWVAVDGELEVESDVEFGRRFTLDLVEHEFHAGILRARWWRRRRASQ